MTQKNKLSKSKIISQTVDISDNLKNKKLKKNKLSKSKIISQTVDISDNFKKQEIKKK